MQFDAQLRPSHAQSLAGTGTIVSTDSVDLLSNNRNLGRGQPMRAIALAVTGFTGGASVQVQVIESDNSNLSSPTVIATGPTVPLASLGVGSVVYEGPMPNNKKRYLGFQYVLTGTFTAGAITSGFVSDTDNQPYLPANTGR